MPPTTQERIARVLLKVTIDPRELNTTSRQLDRFQKETERAFAGNNRKVSEARRSLIEHRIEIERNRDAAARSVDVYRSFGAALGEIERENAIAQLTRELADATKSGKNLEETLERVKQELQEIGATEGEVHQVVRGAQAGGAGRNPLQALGREIRNLPSVPLGGGLTTDAIGNVTRVLGGLGIAATAAAAALGAAIVALKLSTREAETVTRSVINTQAQYYELLKTGTRETIQQEIDRQRQEADILRARVTENQRFFQGLEDHVGGVGRALFDALDVGGTQALRTETEKLEQQLRDTEFGIGRLAQAMHDQDVIARTLAEAEEKLAEIRQQQVDAAIQTQIRATMEITSLTAQQTRDRIQQLEQERKLVVQALATGAASDQLAEQLAQRERDIVTTLTVFSQALPEKERLEAAQALFQRIKDGIEDLAARAAKTVEDLRKVGQEITKLQEAFADKLADIERRRTQAIEDAEFARTEAIAEARRSAAIAEEEAVRKAALQRVEIEQQAQENIARILRRFKFDEANAIQERDAVALDLARRRRDEELENEQDANSKRQRQLDDRLREELRTLDRRFREQLRTIDKRYAEQVRRANLAAQRSIEVETMRYQRELQVKQQAMAAILGIEQRQQQEEITIAANGAQGQVNTHAKMWQTISQLASSALRSFTSSPAQVQRFSTSTQETSGRGFFPSMATGGFITRDGLIYAHQGEMIINPKRGQSANTINFNVTGQTRQQVSRQIDEAKVQLLDILFGD